MFSVDGIKLILDTYTVTNGTVYTKENNIQILDEEIILKVKAAKLIYNEAKQAYLSDQQQFGKSFGNFSRYVEKAMEKLSVNGEINSYGSNKLVNALLNNNGHYEENMAGDQLRKSKFSIFYGEKKEYGLAYLRLKFREKGLDIENMDISLDRTELIKNGVSKVIIDYNIKPLKSKTDDEQNKFVHPKKDVLNQLEQEKQKAKQNNDLKQYRKIQEQIKDIVSKNQVQITTEQWNNMSIEQKKDYITIKMKESKVLEDEDSLNYWYSNLLVLEEQDKKGTQVESHK